MITNTLWNPVSILDMPLLSIISTVDHTEPKALESSHLHLTAHSFPRHSLHARLGEGCWCVVGGMQDLSLSHFS